MNYKFFSHTECEFFPCHKTNDPENCKNCTLPHQRKNYDYVIGKFKEIIEITKLDTEK